MPVHRKVYRHEALTGAEQRGVAEIMVFDQVALAVVGRLHRHPGDVDHLLDFLPRQHGLHVDILAVGLQEGLGARLGEIRLLQRE